jgi:predicted RNase H-like nuclease
MTAILAIDAAWTPTEPSGVALLKQQNNGVWQCLALAPSYAAFIALSNGEQVNWHLRLKGERPNSTTILNTAQKLLNGNKVSIITIDMPLSTVPIISRRVADNEISKAFGKAGCSTHSPTPNRPGNIGLIFSNYLADYPLATAITQPSTYPCLIEVYPHPALLTLTNASFRLQYKVSKSLKYWPKTSIQTRIRELLKVYKDILGTLRKHIEQIPLVLPDPEQINCLAHLKRYEDTLDALVCGWVGIRYLAGQIRCFGDSTAAIWVP